MATKEKELEKRLLALYEQRGEYELLTADRQKYESRLKKEEERSAFRKAAGLFFLPFGKTAFETMKDWAEFLMATILFAGCAAFVGILGLLAAIADVLYLLLYGISYPVLVLFFLLAHPLRLCHFRRMASRLREEEKAFDIGALKSEITMVEKQLKKLRAEEEEVRRVSSSGYVHVSDAVKETDWYKNKVDEEYRRLMGHPPKDTSLPSYATDVTLDMHPGDF